MKRVYFYNNANILFIDKRNTPRVQRLKIVVQGRKISISVTENCVHISGKFLLQVSDNEAIVVV